VVQDKVPRILVVDDNKEFQDFVATLLMREGYEVVTADDGDQALSLVSIHEFDLIISDMFMPNKDGLEFITALKSLRRGIPVIGMSGRVKGPNQPFLTAAEAFGAVRTFVKPFEAKEFTAYVASVIQTYANQERRPKA
jgi:CheY-like chemotaxis protein